MSGLRLRWLGIAVLLITVGLKFMVDGVLNGPNWGSVLFGLLPIGFGGLWLIGRNGLTGGVAFPRHRSGGRDLRDEDSEANRGSDLER